MAHGGKREGAGVKEGSVRPKITTYWTQKDIDGYFKWLKTAYKTRPELAKWVGDQLCGKAPQSVVNPDGSEHPIVFMPVQLIEKYDLKSK